MTANIIKAQKFWRYVQFIIEIFLKLTAIIANIIIFNVSSSNTTIKTTNFEK